MPAQFQYYSLLDDVLRSLLEQTRFRQSPSIFFSVYHYPALLWLLLILNEDDYAFVTKCNKKFSKNLCLWWKKWIFITSYCSNYLLQCTSRHLCFRFKKGIKQVAIVAYRWCSGWYNSMAPREMGHELPNSCRVNLAAIHSNKSNKSLSPFYSPLN